MCVRERERDEGGGRLPNSLHIPIKLNIQILYFYFSIIFNFKRNITFPLLCLTQNQTTQSSFSTQSSVTPGIFKTFLFRLLLSLNVSKLNLHDNPNATTRRNTRRHRFILEQISHDCRMNTYNLLANSGHINRISTTVCTGLWQEIGKRTQRVIG